MASSLAPSLSLISTQPTTTAQTHAHKHAPPALVYDETFARQSDTLGQGAGPYGLRARFGTCTVLVETTHAFSDTFCSCSTHNPTFDAYS